MRRLVFAALLFATGCWTSASFEPLGHVTRPERKPEDVAVLDCAPDGGFIVLGRITAITGSVMPINRQDVAFSTPDGQQAMREEAAKHGCDAIIGAPQFSDPLPCGETTTRPLVDAIGIAFVDGGG
jgi:hypothetical protein